MNPDAGPPPPARPRLRARLTPAAERAVHSGHPWVYADRIRSLNRPGDPGEIAVVYDRHDRFLALALFDPASPIRLRILHTGSPVTVDDAWWIQRWTAAFGRRAGILDAATNGCRLVNGESDGWPGLVLDQYADTWVLKLYTTAWRPWLPRLRRHLTELGDGRRVVLRLSRNAQTPDTADGWQDGSNLIGTDTAESVVFTEDRLRFRSDVVRGQKTGFFLDQRDNRRLVGGMSSGAEVLNAFSFSGGFSLHAARGGAIRVTDLDLSPHALAAARANFALNAEDPSVARAVHETVQADAFAWLATGPRRSFDVVVCDPPSLARRETERTGAIAAYGRLAADCARRVRPGGWLVAASCSAHVTEEEFLGAVRRALGLPGGGWTEVRVTGHAPDHPATFPEARYLKAIHVRRRPTVSRR